MEEDDETRLENKRQQTSMENLEDAIEARQSRFGRYCGILGRSILFCNTMLLYAVVVLVIYELIRIKTLETSLLTEQDHINHLQQKVVSLQKSIPNSTHQEIQIQELDQKVEEEQEYTSYVLSGVFTLLTCLISMFHMSSHLSKMVQPMIQTKIVSILWMSPIYSVTSFLSLLYPPLEGPMKIVKDFYESYCIYQFLSFMIVVLGRGSREQAVESLAKHGDHLQQPTRCLKKFYDPPPHVSNVAKANAIITECQISAMQFVFIRPLTSILYVILVLDPKEEANKISIAENFTRALIENVTEDLSPTPGPTVFDVSDNITTGYDDTFLPTAAPTLEASFFGSNAPTSTPNSTIFSTTSQDQLVEATKGYFMSLSFVLAMFVNISVFFAFMGLLKFYHAVRKDLKWIRPWPKFLTIKGVVFLTFWQGMMISIIVNLEEKSSSEATFEANRYQNILICLEMLFFSVTHWCVFPAEEWSLDYSPPATSHAPGIGIRDFVSDVGFVVKSGRRTSKRRRRQGRRTNQREPKRGLYERTAAASITEEDEDEEGEMNQDSSPVNNNMTIGRRMYDYDDEDFHRSRVMSNDGDMEDDEFDSDENELI